MSDLHKKLAELEFLNDQLDAELAQADHLLKKLGFSEGVNSLKAILEDWEKALKAWEEKE